MLEGACHDCGTVINWAQSIGTQLLFNRYCIFVNKYTKLVHI